MKVLITGVGGFLGSFLVREMKGVGYDILAYGRNRGNGIQPCDLSSAPDVFNMLENEKPDVVINCAATVNWENGALPGLYPVNVVAPSLIAAWCEKNDKYLVQTSSSSVHGVRATYIDEATVENPDSDYGKSKLLADHAIQASGCKYAIVRFGGIFGQSGPSHLGINNVIRDAQNGIAPTIFGTGKAKRNYIHVSDASKIIEFCVRARPLGVFYGSAREPISIDQMFHAICEVFLPGKNPSYKDGPDAIDQIIKPSDIFPPTKSFIDALRSEL